jgi:hypothetical protein
MRDVDISTRATPPDQHRWHLLQATSVRLAMPPSNFAKRLRMVAVNHVLGALRSPLARLAPGENHDNNRVGFSQIGCH